MSEDTKLVRFLPKNECTPGGPPLTRFSLPRIPLPPFLSYTVRKIVLKLFLYLYFRTKVLKFTKVILKFRNLSEK